jgi:homoserine kinase
MTKGTFVSTCTVHVPATSANLGVGFDTFGLALALWNRFEIQRLAEGETPTLKPLPTSQFSIATKLGWDAVGTNVFFQALRFYYERVQRPLPAYAVAVEIHIPVARGLGSSATAVVAALLGANHLEGSPLSEAEILALAIAFEGHPDNVSPALKGGCVFGDESSVYALSWPSTWHTAVWIPEDALLTEAARQVLPLVYPRTDVVSALRHATMLLYAIEHTDAPLLQRILQADCIHEPYRKSLIEGFEAFRAYVHVHTEAYGVVISGSGSTCLVIFEASQDKLMKNVLTAWQNQWGGHVQLLPIERRGAYLET